MAKFGFGEVFLSLVQLRYNAPVVTIREAGRVSQPFSLYRGTRQGCLLCPLLFAIAIEPLAAMLHSNPCIGGFQHGEIQEKNHALCR